MIPFAERRAVISPIGRSRSSCVRSCCHRHRRTERLHSGPEASVRDDFTRRAEFWRATGAKLQVVVRGDTVILYRKPKSVARALAGAARGMYPAHYLDEERMSW